MPGEVQLLTSGGKTQIHDFDVARWLVNDDLEEIYVHGSCRVDPEIGKAGDIDTSLCVMKFANGAVVTIDNCRKASYGYDQVSDNHARLQFYCVVEFG